MKEPSVVVQFPDGTRWRIPSGIIAEDRASHYSNKDFSTPTAATQAYSREYYLTLADDEAIIDWARNDLNWSDVKDECEQLPTIVQEINYETEWSNAEMSVER